MNPALKQRLIGAVMLIALGVIFLPSVFNGGRHRQNASLMAIPSPPEVSPMAFEEPVRPAMAAGDDDPQQQASKVFALEPKEGNEAPRLASLPTKQQLDAKGLPSAWVLQVASFTDNKKAEALKQKLQKKKYKAFIREVKNDNQTVMRVLVGPEMDSKKLGTIKASIDKTFKVKSLIIKFEP